MSIYLDYLAEIDSRKTQGLAPKPIDDGVLLGEIITIIQDAASEHRADALKFFIYNTLPGTTSAAAVKAAVPPWDHLAANPSRHVSGGGQ